MTTTTTQSEGPGFLKRLLLAFIKLTLFFIILAVLAVGGYRIYQEIDRSFGAVSGRMEINTRRIEESNRLVDTLLTRIEEQQADIDVLETAVSSQDALITTLTTGTEELETTQTEQNGLLTALNTQIGDSITNDIINLNGGLIALQNDITDNGAQIDQLGGTADSLQGDIANLNTQLETTQTALEEFPAAEIVKMRQTLTLFRIWELTSRARLRLLEGNAGQAAIDVNSAILIADKILANDNSEKSLALVQPVQERLALVASSLPDDPTAAARDLETAWEALDAALVSLLEN